MIGVDVELDAGPRARQGGNRSRHAPIEGAILVTVDNVAGVVACAIGSAVAIQLRCGEVGTNLLRRGPEVVDRVLQVGKDGAVRDKDTVCSNALARIRQGEGVVQSERRLRIRETIKIPVGLSMLAE